MTKEEIAKAVISEYSDVDKYPFLLDAKLDKEIGVPQCIA